MRCRTAGSGFVKCSAFTHIPGIAEVLQSNTITPYPHGVFPTQGSFNQTLKY